MKVILRTLSRKSVMGFGRHHSQTVKDLIAKKKIGYLAYCYYNCSNISFLDDILDEIGADVRIEKPGTSPDSFDNKKYKWCRNTMNLKKTDMYDHSISKSISRKNTERNRGGLQRINHGHY